MAIVMPPYSPAGFNVNSGYTPGGAYTNAQATGFDPNAALYALMQREQMQQAGGGGVAPSAMRGGMGAAAPSAGHSSGGGPGAPITYDAGRHAVYSKVVGGAGITPGRMRLDNWEPGADASGTAAGPAPDGPAKSSFVDTSGGGEEAPKGEPVKPKNPYSDPYSPAYRALVDKYGGQSGAQDALRRGLA